MPGLNFELCPRSVSIQHMASRPTWRQISPSCSAPRSSTRRVLQYDKHGGGHHRRSRHAPTHPRHDIQQLSYTTYNKPLYREGSMHAPVVMRTRTSFTTRYQSHVRPNSVTRVSLVWSSPLLAERGTHLSIGATAKKRTPFEHVWMMSDASGLPGSGKSTCGKKAWLSMHTSQRAA
jgi:hypothetical protein